MNPNTTFENPNTTFEYLTPIPRTVLPREAKDKVPERRAHGPFSGALAALLIAGLFVQIAPIRAGILRTWGGKNVILSEASPLKAIACGTWHNLGVQQDGTVIAWGDNFWDQSTVPDGLTDVVAVAGGSYHSLALKRDGTVVAWGTSIIDPAVPLYFRASVPPGLSDVVAVAAGYDHSLALKRDGTVVSWGEAGWGYPPRPVAMPELNDVVAIAAAKALDMALRRDGTVVSWGGPALETPPGLNQVVAIATGGSHCLALKNDGTIVAWGENGAGQATVPDGLSDVVAIAAGGAHSVVLKQDGTVVAFGDNSAGQLNVPLGLNQVVAIAAGDKHSLALKSDGSVVVWGAPRTAEGLVPGELRDLVMVAYEAVDVRAPHLVGLKADGTVIALGANGYGQCNVPAGLSNVVAVAAGYYRSLALKSDGTIVGWGGDFYGFDGGPLGLNSAPAGLSNVVAIDAGYTYNLALKSDGTLVLWGAPSWFYHTPTLPEGLSNVVAIAAGGLHVLALKSDGTVVAFGNNQYGQIDVPPGLSNVVAISASEVHSLALKSDGTVVSWGGGVTSRTRPNVPEGLSNVVAIVAAFTALDPNVNFAPYSMALKRDGTVAYWGGFAETMPAGLKDVVAISGPQPLVLLNQPPEVFCQDVIVSAGPDCTAQASIDHGSFDIDPGDSITLTQDPPGPYGLGETLVTLTATDSWGASSQCTAKVTVVDVTPPVLECPATMSINATSPDGAQVTAYPDPKTALDACGTPTVGYSPSAGGVFPIGDTTVLCTATDAAGNQSSCAFTVHVKGVAEQLNDLIALVNRLTRVKANPKNALLVKLKDVQAALALNDTATACVRLTDFISLAKAQRDKRELSLAQANLLINEATRLRAVLGCP